MYFRWLTSTTTTTGTSERSGTTPGTIPLIRWAFTQGSSGSSTASSDSVATVDLVISGSDTADSVIAGFGVVFTTEGSAAVVSEAVEDFVAVDLAAAAEFALAAGKPS